MIEPEFIPPVRFMGAIIGVTNRWDFPWLCEACDKKRKEESEQAKLKERSEREAREKIENERALNEMLAKMVGLRGYEDFDIGKFVPDLNSSNAFKSCREFDLNAHNIYLWGPAGVGKSHLAVSTFKMFFKDYSRSVFIKHSNLNRSMQGLMSEDYDSRLAKYVTAPMMVVDDLGTAKRTEFSDQVLYEVLDGRYMAKKNGMIITSNLSLKDLAVALGDDRLVSRIAGMCEVIKIEGKDRRLSK